VILQRPLTPAVVRHFFNGFCLMTAGRQTPSPLHRRFLTHAAETPAGLNPHGLLAFKNLHLCEQQSPPSHCSLASLIPFPQLDVAVLELVPVLEDDLEAVGVPV